MALVCLSPSPSCSHWVCCGPIQSVCAMCVSGTRGVRASAIASVCVGMDDSHGGTEIARVYGCQRVRVCAVLSMVGSDVPPRCGLAACDCPGTFTLGHGSTDCIRYKCMCVVCMQAYTQAPFCSEYFFLLGAYDDGCMQLECHQNVRHFRWLLRRCCAAARAAACRDVHLQWLCTRNSRSTALPV